MDVQQAIERGIAAARANNQPTAYYYFYTATQADPTNEQAWLWRASTALHPRDALYCLAAVLALNPNNLVAKHGLEQISAAVAAESTPETVSITPSLSTGEYKPPERRLEWQQSFQRELYDLAHVPRMERLRWDTATEELPAPPPVEAESVAYRRPPGAGRRLLEALRRIFVDRDTQRVQFAIPVVIAVVLLIGGVALLGLGQLNNPAPPRATPTTLAAGGLSTATVASGVVTTTVTPPSTATLVASTAPTLAPTSAPTQAQPATAPPTKAPSLPPATATSAAPTATHAVPPTNTAPPPPTNTAPPPASPTPQGQTVVVAGGQTLPQIAQQAGVSVAALWAYNNLTNVRDVHAGVTLKIPPAGYKPPGEVQYIVQSGDAVYNIALLFGTTSEAIAQRNNLESAGQISVGQTLIIPVP